MEIPENMHEGGNRPAPVEPAIFFFFFFLEGGLCLVCIWESLVKFQGGGGGEVVVKFDVFSHCYAACLFDASDDPLC